MKHNTISWHTLCFSEHEEGAGITQCSMLKCPSVIGLGLLYQLSEWVGVCNFQSLRLVSNQIIHDYRLSQFKLPHKQDLSSICFYDKKNQCNVNIFPTNCIPFILVKPVKLSKEILQDENCMNVYSPHINAHFEIPRLTKNLSFSSNDNLNE